MATSGARFSSKLARGTGLVFETWRVSEEGDSLDGSGCTGRPALTRGCEVKPLTLARYEASCRRLVVRELHHTGAMEGCDEFVC
jgi:hypothetical protein